MNCGYLGFKPNDGLEDRCYFWSVNSGYGLFTQKDGRCELKVVSGTLNLRRLETPLAASTATLNGVPVNASMDGCTAAFAQALQLTAGDVLQLS